MTQAVAQRVIELVPEALATNAPLDRIDVNAARSCELELPG